MKLMTGQEKRRDVDMAQLDERYDGQNIRVHGMVHNLRRMNDFAFIILRGRNRILQCVSENAGGIPEKLSLGDSVVLEGTLKMDERAPGGFELQVTSADVLSHPDYPMAVDIAKRDLRMTIDKLTDLRPIDLRNLKERAVFKIQEGIARGFREYLQNDGFTEIHTPKIVASGAEGGANIFKLDYFGKKAYLAQSPQFYKQTLVGVYERVFEIGPVFRAEKHSTTRHLNEYVSMDFEMGFIDSFEDIMEVEAAMLKYMMELLKEHYAYELELLGVELPKTDAIPSVRFDEAKKMVSEKYSRRIRDPFDLEPEEEQLISRLFKEEYDSDFVFVTHYPSKKRPFYAMDDPDDKRYTLSFYLLFRGMEITTGGQRIHDYSQQVEKMISKGMDPAAFESYLMIHKYGMPPHGGLGIGLERLTMKLLDHDNIRRDCMFPRDMHRLVP